MEWLCCVYRLLVRAYPKQFRQDFGAEMARAFRDRGLEIARKEGSMGLIRYSALTTCDWLQTVVQERMVFMQHTSLSALRWIFLACVVLDVALVKRISTPRMVSAPLPFALLIMYGLLVLLLTTNRVPVKEQAWFGIATGMALASWTTSFSVRPPNASGWVVAGSCALVAIVFGCWGIAGFRAAQRTGLAGSGWLAGCWSAVVCMLVEITLALVFFSAARPWIGASDLLAASGQHLLEGPLIGAVLGAFGGFVAWSSGMRGPVSKTFDNVP